MSVKNSPFLQTQRRPSIIVNNSPRNTRTPVEKESDATHVASNTETPVQAKKSDATHVASNTETPVEEKESTSGITPPAAFF